MMAGHVVDEFIKVRIVEEQLGNDVIGACINFFFQVPPVGVFAFRAGDVALGKPGYSYAKVSILADKSHQLARKLESALGEVERATARRVAAQRQRALDA